MSSFHMGMFPTMSLTPSSPSVVAPSLPPSIDLPVRPVPGSYGWPLLGPLSDRLDYFWFQKPEAFFRKRIDKYKSTVFRTNVPPSFPFSTNVNPNVVALLDCKSFAHLFDVDLIDKKNVLVGDFMPSVAFTGNIRVGVYQDTSEPQHPKVRLIFLPPLSEFFVANYNFLFLVYNLKNFTSEFNRLTAYKSLNSNNVQKFSSLLGMITEESVPTQHAARVRIRGI